MPTEHKSVYRRIFSLAIPVSIGQAGNILANIADTLMLGKYDSDHMVAAATGFQVFIMPFVFLIGLTIGLTSYISNKIGEKKDASVLGTALLTFFISGIGVAVLLWFLSLNMNWFHPDATIQNLSSNYLGWMALSILPISIFLTGKQFFEGYELSLITTVVGLIGNGLNVILNYGFIFGNWGFEPRGVEGAGIATFISRLTAVPLFILAIYLFKNYRVKLDKKLLRFSWKDCKELLALGIPMGIQIFIEVVAFAVTGIMTGWISLDAQGAHQIALQLAALTFLIAGGFGSAATVLVGQFYGEKNKPKVIEVIKKILLLVFLYEVVTALLFFAFSYHLPPLFLKKEEVQMIIISVSLIKMAAIFQIPDGIQNALHGILRGLQDTKKPTYFSIGSHWIVTLLGGYLMAFHTNQGVLGIWIGFILGLTVLAVLLGIRTRKILMNW